jgi:hypothetical protein
MRFVILVVFAAVFLAAAGAAALVHRADTGPDGVISLSELLREVQFFNAGQLHVDAATEDGYAPGSGNTDGPHHDSDYAPADWRISLNELLRLIQFFNAGGYDTRPGTEDGFLPAPDRAPHRLPVPGDTDGDLLSDVEEACLGLDPANPHEFGEDDVDSAVLARRVLEQIAPWPQCWTLTDPPDGTFCVDLYEAECGCLPDPVTGDYICLGSFIEYYVTVPDGRELLFTLPDEARHFMAQGSFSYFPLPCGAAEPDDVWGWDPANIRRVDVCALGAVLDGG